MKTKEENEMFLFLLFPLRSRKSKGNLLSDKLENEAKAERERGRQRPLKQIRFFFSFFVLFGQLKGGKIMAQKLKLFSA
jgi:hypothetical protein